MVLSNNNMKTLIKNQSNKAQQANQAQVSSKFQFQLQVQIPTQAQCCAKTSKNVPGCHD